MLSMAVVVQLVVVQTVVKPPVHRCQYIYSVSFTIVGSVVVIGNDDGCQQCLLRSMVMTDAHIV